VKGVVSYPAWGHHWRSYRDFLLERTLTRIAALELSLNTDKERDRLGLLAVGFWTFPLAKAVIRKGGRHRGASSKGRLQRTSGQVDSVPCLLSTCIISAAIEGRLPRGLGLTRLTELPTDWVEQRRVLGLA
jgi:hypothetical protein